ncbi:serine/threonine-protein kinase [Leifsonia sp. Root112D2]|uniref:serine/threonine-protein kinase n=1 Tax=Leifsonia sp. Root112D2 TaxID=1736426 RepID=UPI000A5916DC|nr:serine/threonine-protein kinase [Leifsonia sp. Root112D2]
MSVVADDPFIGRLIGDRYRIVGLIGRGGMASVYRADDGMLHRQVALKLLLADSTDAAELGRQRVEIETLASLNHHALVTLFDAGTEATDAGERAFLVMEVVDGRNLRDAIAYGLDATQIAHIGADVAEALHYVHGRGVVHRDVKPANILLATGGLPGRPVLAKLADFGIARLIDSSRLTSTGVVMGTASYLSPEQARGGEVGPATDVYSLGIVLLEALTGENPFPGTAVESASARLSREPHVPGALGHDWGSLLTAMTALDPDQRMSAADAAVATRRIANAASVVVANDATVPAGVATVPTVPIGGASPTVAMTAPPATTRSPTTPPPTTPSTAEHNPTAATLRYPAAPSKRPPGERPPRTLPASRRIIGVACAVVIVIAAAGGVLAWGAADKHPTPTPSPYPSVSGTLGTHLKQLQKSVQP